MQSETLERNNISIITSLSTIDWRWSHHPFEGEDRRAAEKQKQKHTSTRSVPFLLTNCVFQESSCIF